jgi:parvulin-like peptidyl-prolyl isomerase
MKILSTLTLATAISFAGIVDGAAIKVGDKIITLYDIYKAKHHLKVEDPIDYLVRKKLEEIEANRVGVNVDDFEVDSAIDDIVTRNQTTRIAIRDSIAQKGMSWQDYKNEIREQILKDRLYKKITNITPVEEKDIREYYEKSQKEFMIPKKIKLIEYTSKNRDSIMKSTKNPLIVIEGVAKKELIVDTTTLDKKSMMAFTQTDEGKFTDIISNNGEFATYYVVEKLELSPIPYSEIKNFIHQKLISFKEEQAISNHFEKLKVNSKITVIRVPN